MAMQKLAGKLFILSLSDDDTTYTSYACATSNDFQRTMETSESRCKEDGGYSDPVPTVASATLSQDGLFQVDDTDQSFSTEQLDTWMKAGTKLYFKYGLQAAGEKQYTGRCYITSLTGPTSGIDDTATFSLELVVSGEWSLAVNA